MQLVIPTYDLVTLKFVIELYALIVSTLDRTQTTTFRFTVFLLRMIK